MLYNYLHTGLIRMLFPKARIIHCRRDPLDHCLAIFFTSFATDYHKYAYDLAEIGAVYSQYLRLMEHWRKVFDEPFLEIEYEELVNNAEKESRRMIEYVGLDWDDRCLEYYATNRTIKTASNWQVRQPVYRDSVKRWKNYEPYLDTLRNALAASPD
jgi:Sulfotransferase domain.